MKLEITQKLKNIDSELILDLLKKCDSKQDYLTIKDDYADIHSDVIDIILENKKIHLSDEKYVTHVVQGLSYFKNKELLESILIQLSKNLKEKYLDRDNIGKFFDKFSDKFEDDGWECLCLNPNVPEWFFEKYMHDKNKIKWKYLSRNTGISEEFFERHLDKVDWRELCQNPNMSEKFFEKHLDKIQWYGICENSKISLSFFEKYFDKLEDLEQLCNNNFRNSKKDFSKWLKNNPQYPFDNLLQNYVTFFPKLTC